MFSKIKQYLRMWVRFYGRQTAADSYYVSLQCCAPHDDPSRRLRRDTLLYGAYQLFTQPWQNVQPGPIRTFYVQWTYATILYIRALAIASQFCALTHLQPPSVHYRYTSFMAFKAAYVCFTPCYTHSLKFVNLRLYHTLPTTFTNVPLQYIWKNEISIIQ